MKRRNHMKKKIISCLLTLVMVLSMLPVSAFAASKVLALTVTADKASASVGETINYTVKVNAETANKIASIMFTLDIPDGLAYVEGSGKVDPNFAATAGADADYDYTEKERLITAATVQGFKDLTNLTMLTFSCTVKEGTVGAQTMNLKEVEVTNASYDLYPTEEYNITPATVTITKAPIASVSAKVDAPQKGKALDTTVDIGTATGYTSKVEWYKGNTATGTAVTGSAAANQVYTAKITLTASSGESFAKGVTTPTGYTKVSANATTIVLTKTFPATAEKTLTGITIKTCPHTTYTAGEQFNKAGMVITAAYDDGSTKDVQPTYFQFTPVDSLTVNDQEVTITYTEGNVTQIAKQKITVNPKALTANMVQSIASQPYTGSAIEPTVTVNVGNKTLTAGTDYTVTYKDNTDVGTAKVIVTGKGNYTGSVETKFNITAKALTASMVWDIAAQTYTGSPIVPELTVKDGETALSKDTDYTVEYQNNLNAATATVT